MAARYLPLIAGEVAERSEAGGGPHLPSTPTRASSAVTFPFQEVLPAARLFTSFAHECAQTCPGAFARTNEERNGDVVWARRLLLHDHLGADRHAVIEIDDLVVDQTEAAGRHRVSDCIRRIGAMDAIDCVAEIERAGTEWIARTACHLAPQIGLPFKHFRRRRPVRPLLLAPDPLHALPLETVAADPDAVAHGAVVGLHQLEKTLGGVDDDRARLLVRAIEHHLMSQIRAERGFRFRTRQHTRIGVLDGRQDRAQLGGRAVLGVSFNGDQTDRRHRQDCCCCKLDTHRRHYQGADLSKLTVQPTPVSLLAEAELWRAVRRRYGERRMTDELAAWRGCSLAVDKASRNMCNPREPKKQATRAQAMIDLHYWTTPNGHKIAIFLEEAGLPYKIFPVNIGKGEQFKREFLAISPNNRIPAMVDHDPPGGGAPIAVFESGAMLLYLADKTKKFIAQDLRGRTDTIQWLFWQMGNLGPMSGDR